MTATATTMPTAWTTLVAALHTRRPVLMRYHGRQREICPHALGSKAGRPMMLGYQTGGQTTTGSLDPDPRKRWRCFYVDEIDHIVAADLTSPWGTADNYDSAEPFPAGVIDELVTAINAD